MQKVYGNVVYGFASHAEGYLCKAGVSESDQYAGQRSHAEGNSTFSAGNDSHAEGQSTQSIGTASHAEGASTVAKSDASHAEGESTVASGSASHAEGYSTVASGNFSHAEGQGCESSGSYSHTEGLNNSASGTRAHCGGYLSSSNSQDSFAHGLGVSANGSEQAVFGRYNATSTTDLFQVGNGTSDGARNNAMKVTSEGDIINGYGDSLHEASSTDVSLFNGDQTLANGSTITLSASILGYMDLFLNSGQGGTTTWFTFASHANTNSGFVVGDIIGGIGIIGTTLTFFSFQVSSVTTLTVLLGNNIRLRNIRARHHK